MNHSCVSLPHSCVSLPHSCESRNLPSDRRSRIKPGMRDNEFWRPRTIPGMSFALLLTLFIGINLSLFAAKTSPEKFRLIHADKLFMTKTYEEQALELSGKVHFFYGNTEFKSDRALILDLKKIARLSGNVVVNNDSLILTADTLAYYRIPELMNVGGRVTATHSNSSGAYRWMQSDFASYDKKNDILTCWSRVSSYDKEENARARCGYAQWDRAKGYALMLEQPYLTSAQNDTLNITAEKMEFFDQEKKLIATFDVQVNSRDYNATSDFLIYFMNDDKAVFTGEPRFVSDYATATANEFHLLLTERKLKRAELIDSCRVDFSEEKGGEQKNRVFADLISMDFWDDQLRGFEAEGLVNYYFQQDEAPKKDFFVNSATGSYLQAEFDENSKLRTMQMKTGVKGKYVFKQ